MKRTDEHASDVEQVCGVPLPDGVTLLSAFVRARKPAD